ncbi:hypothetical protein MNBD_UNCLBAC01-1632 [hydrothermal vent metagenome]|uniref:Uncharacterized protein n=1 Tax=hydrothermal vent metagenome TaxID=652676 RepID=A0A3B1DFG4_9ZZZZ
MGIHKKTSRLYRILSTFLIFIFSLSLITPPVQAQQTILNLPFPGAMLSLSNAYMPTLVRGMTLYPENPLQFDFLIDHGDEGLDGEAFKKESRKLIKYFLATLTTPENELWVNLSPYEQDRIIPQGLDETELGRDLLAQDYILKQLTASLMYPEDDLGGEFWDQVYAKAQEKFGTTEIPLNTFNKVWIVPETAVVYEHEQSVFIIENRLKVLLEEDYLALQNNLGVEKFGLDSVDDMNAEVISGVTSEIVKEILIPAIEKEVNEGKNFANLRQIYHSMLLATWYKRNLQESLLGQVYVDKKKTKGVDVEDKKIKQKIFNQYVEAFKKGVYDYVRDDFDPTTQKIIPRKYFSGGAISIRGIEIQNENNRGAIASSVIESARREEFSKVGMEAVEESNVPSEQIEEALKFAASPVVAFTVRQISNSLDHNLSSGDIREAVEKTATDIKEKLENLTISGLGDPTQVAYEVIAGVIVPELVKLQNSGDIVTIESTDTLTTELLRRVNAIEDLQKLAVKGASGEIVSSSRQVSASSGVETQFLISLTKMVNLYFEQNLEFLSDGQKEMLLNNILKFFKNEMTLDDFLNSVKFIQSPSFRNKETTEHFLHIIEVMHKVGLHYLSAEGLIKELKNDDYLFDTDLYYFLYKGLWPELADDGKSVKPSKEEPMYNIMYQMELDMVKEILGINRPARVKKVDYPELSIGDDRLSDSDYLLIIQAIFDGEGRGGTREQSVWSRYYLGNLTAQAAFIELMFINQEFYSFRKREAIIGLLIAVKNRLKPKGVIEIVEMVKNETISNDELIESLLRSLVYGSEPNDPGLGEDRFKKILENIKTEVNASSALGVGGINLNPATLDLQIKRDANWVPLPMDQQPIFDMKIDGFSPVIINVTPVNIPFLLGFQTNTCSDDESGDTNCAESGMPINKLEEVVGS